MRSTPPSGEPSAASDSQVDSQTPDGLAVIRVAAVNSVARMVATRASKPARPSGIIAALAAAAAVAVAALAAPAAHAAQHRHHARIVLGANSRTYPAMHARVPLARAARIYSHSTDPADWPQTWPVSPAPCTLWSFNPLPGPLLHHVYDRQLRVLFRSAPPCSEATIWYENAVGNNPRHYPAAVRDPARYRRMQSYMEWLVRGTHVKFGTLGCGPVNQSVKWYAPRLDWYGTDLYFNPVRYLSHHRVVVEASPFSTPSGTVSEAKVWARMDANLAAWRAVSHQRYPLIRIGESNAMPDSRRIAWFTDVVGWFDRHDGLRSAWLLTFWHTNDRSRQGGLSGAWPPGAGVVSALRQIARVHS